MRFGTFIYNAEVYPLHRASFSLTKISLPIVSLEFPLQGEYTFLDGNFPRFHPLCVVVNVEPVLIF